jgi:hypothetical protein
MNLNDRQQSIVSLGVALFVLMSLIPPWKYSLDASGVVYSRPARYAFIGSPPEPEAAVTLAGGVEIDFSRLILQWLVVGAATGLGAYRTQTPVAESEGTSGE